MATAGVTVGSVWLDVLPSMRNFGSELVSQTEGVSRQAGERAGESLGEGTASGFKAKAAAVAAAGAAIGIAVGAAISQALDIQAGQARLTAQLGLAANESERYGRIAGEVYSNAYGESLDQVNEAIANVHRNIGANLNDADLSTITGTVLNLSDAFGVELVGSTQAVGQLMKTGLAPNAAAALDVITRGFQLGVDRGGDFLDTITEYSVQFQKFGLDAQLATGLLVQGMQAGARNSDLVADAIKEFSIRAVDGSKLTADGFRMVGLDAGKMAAEIAKGGPSASAALDLTLDRLRAMPDPVARSQAAVALFGTQAEDLGQALFALDPSSAVNALGQVGGAADRMNNTLGNTAQANLTTFMRTLQLVFVDVVGGYVIPAITTLAGIISPVLGPALSFVGGLITGVIVPAFQAFGQWVQNNTSWLVPLAAGVGVFVLALNAVTIATTLWGVATSIASGIVGIVRGAVMSFQVAMWLLNVAMAANPIGIVIAVLAGLVAAVVVAWNTSETFRNVVTGAWSAIQSAASTAWSFLQTVFGAIGSAAVAVGSFFASIWTGGIVPAFQAVGNAASWLWSTILSPVFSAIGLAARVLIAIITTVLVAPWLIAWNLLSAAVGLLWTGAVQPAFAAIQSFVGGVWSWLQANVFGPIGAALGVLGGLFGGFATQASGAWSSVQSALQVAWSVIDSVVFAPVRAGIALLVTAFQFFQAQASAAWSAVQAALGVAWSWIKSVVIDPAIAIITGPLTVAQAFFRDGATGAWQAVQNMLGGVWSWVETNVFRPIDTWLTNTFGIGFGTFRDAATTAWNAVRDAINVVWSFIRDQIWQPLVTFVTQTIPNAFNTAVDAVGRVWDGLREKFAAPIRFVVDVVYNNGIVKAWNWIANLVSLPTLSTVALGFARGGVVDDYGALPGYAPGRDSMLAMVSPGEAWMRPEFTRTVGKKWIDQVNTVARRGGQRAVQDFLLYGGEKPSQFAAGGVVAGQNFARSQSGKPYVWGGVGPGGYDCSGFISAVTNVVLGLAPHSRRFATGSFSANRGAGGFQPGTGSAFVIGVSPDTGSGVGHMAGSLGGLGVESRGGQGVVVGGGARSPNDRLFPWRFFLPQVGGEFVDSGGGGWFDPAAWVKSLFKDAIDAVAGLAGDNQWAQLAAGTAKRAVDGTVDWFVDWATNNVAKIIDLIIPFDSGGYLPTGWSAVFNGTGRPEPVLTDAQWRAMAESGAGSDGAALDARFAELATAIREQPPITVEDHSGNPVETARQTQLAIRLAR